ncbi:MAG TPA: TonB-dependent receptor, partial [Usitatibacter sp.]|nr:TonB-dependent receptor [Usitatibacter sp.]
APRGDTNGTPRLSEDRQARYGAVFAENVFRLGPFHVVPSLRWEHEELRIDEGVKPANLSRPLIHADYRKDVPLAGIGIGNDFGPGNETYVNVSQGYRPLRYLDVAGPFANFAAGNNPDPPRSVSYEAGVHGWPARGFYYDVGLFEVDFRHRIETQAVNATDVVNVNTGDTRHRGIEAEAHYDVAPWLHRPASEHLEIFGNASLLEARFTASAIAGQVGRVPAYAPRYLLRAGVLWRDAADSRAGLSVTSVGSQFWQDSNADFGSGAAFVPARIPAFTVVDLSGQWAATPRVRLIAALSNALDSRYYARVFQNAIEPANRRAWRAGATIDF